MKRINLMMATLALLAFSGLAFGQTVPLNTGYNHSIPALSPVSLTNPSTTADNYWINKASSFPPQAPTTTFVLKTSAAPWLTLPNADWISASNQVASASGTNTNNPSYTIFRKCYCLLPGFQNVSVRFTTRADDNITVWFNNTLNSLLPASSGRWNSGVPLVSLPSNPSWFHVGKNCIYVLVEDTGGHMGFTMDGNISATWGLLPKPAMGTGQSFEPCSCGQGPAGQAESPLSARREADDSDEQVIKEIVKIAESRRLQRRN